MSLHDTTQHQRAIIIQPGALGDTLLTLPLARTLRQAVGVGAVDLLGHMDNLCILPERSDIHSVCSLDTVELHRLFQDPTTFQVTDRDPLIYAFANYTWILSFLGEPNSHFEANLLFTVHCHHSAEVVMLPLKPPADYPHHVTALYLEQFSAQSPVPEAYPLLDLRQSTLWPTTEDCIQGKQHLKQIGLQENRPLVVIHPGSGGHKKCWHLKNFLAVARQWQQQDGQVLFIIGPVEQDRWPSEALRQLADRAPLLRDLSLEQTVAVLSQADVVVTNDNGISHLAAGLGRNTLVLFGPTAPHQYRPIGPKVHIIHSPEPEFAEDPNVNMQTQVLAKLNTILQD